MRLPAAVLVACLALAGCSGSSDDGVGGRTPEARASSAAPTAGDPTSSATAEPELPLAGRVVVLDPGHQLGNRSFPDEVNRLVEAGGTRKPCNTTGTSTDAGYPEATLTWDVSQRVTRRLEALGARVVATRDRNSERAWGPCVDQRGRAGNSGADLKLSIHADGSYAPAADGFHVIVAPGRAPSRDLALDVRREMRRAGFAYATYVGGDGLDVRSDLGTLNLATIPAAMVELGNMRSPADARVMTTARGRQRYADALVAAVRAYLRSA